VTLHEDLAREELDNTLSRPGSAAAFTETLRTLRTGHYDSTIGQTHQSPRYWPNHQIAAYMRVYAELAVGNYAFGWVHVGATPGPDADREENADKLRNLAPGIHAEVDLAQNMADQDGSLTWTDPMRGLKLSGATYRAACGVGEQPFITFPCDLAPRWAPLEIGYTLPSRTMLHMIEDGAVARWAYGSDKIVVLVDVKRRERQARMWEL